MFYLQVIKSVLVRLIVLLLFACFHFLAAQILVFKFTGLFKILVFYFPSLALFILIMFLCVLIHFEINKIDFHIIVIIALVTNQTDSVAVVFLSLITRFYTSTFLNHVATLSWFIYTQIQFLVLLFIAHFSSINFFLVV